MNNELNNSFETIKEYKNDIENILGYINNKVDELNIIYNNYLKEINDKLTYRISLDTFNFQTKLIDFENNNNHKLFKIFFNRIYGDYYKLYKKLIQAQKEEVNLKESSTVNSSTYIKDHYTIKKKNKEMTSLLDKISHSTSNQKYRIYKI